MIIIDNKVVLYFEPRNKKSDQPIIDELTIKMFNSFKSYVSKGSVNFNRNPRTNIGTIYNENPFSENIGTMGIHECICGEESSTFDYLLEDGYITNSLCVHYLAYHRDAVSEEDINKVKNMSSSPILDENDRPMLMSMIWKDYDKKPEEKVERYANNPQAILYIEPKNQRSDVPIIDEYTKKMVIALKNNKRADIIENFKNIDIDSFLLSCIHGQYKKRHHCICGAYSSKVDYLLDKDIGYFTNSLCVHYLAVHRDEIPEEEFDKINDLDVDQNYELTEEDKQILMQLI